MSEKIKIIDVRPIESREKHNEIFKMFFSLKPGESMLLINDHDPKPLYYQMEAENKNEFDWKYIENGPETWKVNIKKTGR